MASTLVFDGDCGICQASVDLLARLGCAATPVPSWEWVRTHPDDDDRCRSSVLLVRPDGTTLVEERAVAGVLRECRRPGPWLAAVVELPGVRVLARHVYRFVAAHRGRISRLVGRDACAIPEAGR
jgi:predicted DCC family thiol-disulfide oxidoreductase YuxK